MKDLLLRALTIDVTGQPARVAAISDIAIWRIRQSLQAGR